MSEWKSVKLGELYEVHNGLSKGRKFFGSGYPFLSFSKVFNNYFIPDELTDLVQSTESERDSYSIHRGDIFVTRTSETSDELGMSCVALKDYPDATYNGFTKRMRPITDRVLPEYIGYYMRMPSFRGEFQAFSTMTTRASLKNEDLLSLSVSLPSLDEQNRIAQALLNYDNLIENNQKQIKLLDEAAKRLYKEWFVDLRFPGHEDVQIVDGVPEGWKKVSVNDCLELHMNGGWGKESPSGKNTHPGRVIRGTDINDIKAGIYKGVPLRYHNDNDILKRVLHKGDIVFELSNGNIDNIGRSLLIDELILQNCGENTICASFCKMLRPKDKIRGLVLYWEIQDMQSDGRMKPFKKQGANGINNFAFEDFLEHQLLVPRTNVLLLPLENIMREMSTIQRRFALLIEARDRLLPKLMSGEIEL